MDELTKQTDLSRERPSRRSLLPPWRPASAIGRHRRTVPLLSRITNRIRPGRRVRVDRETDLPTLEGDPTSRADLGLFRLEAEIHPLRGHVRIEIEAPAQSQQGTAVIVIMLLVTGAILGAAALAADARWRFPSAVSAIVTALLFVSPILTYIAMRRRR
jgi:hypothetical protein